MTWLRADCRGILLQPPAILHLIREAKLTKKCRLLLGESNPVHLFHLKTKPSLGTRQYYIFNFTLLKYISGEANETHLRRREVHVIGFSGTGCPCPAALLRLPSHAASSVLANLLLVIIIAFDLLRVVRWTAAL